MRMQNSVRISDLFAIVLCALSATTWAFSFHAQIPASSVVARTMTLNASPKNVLTVDLDDRSYPIYIGSGLLDEGEQLKKYVKSNKALIVTNTKVGPLYSASVRRSLESKGVTVYEVVLPDGEEYKNMDVLMAILDKAMDSQLDRKSTMIALGGGVVGDMTGFAAAIFQRGIRFIQIPTTLMAMVDSAVGGKTAVNHPLGKNMIGAFYQPDAVIIDIDTLKTLPDRELCSGISEVIKYGLIRDPVFFEWLEANMPKLVGRDSDVIAEAVLRSCENKAKVVAADEKEGGIRASLNLGHTFGHAIETGMGYGTWLHGEAVATGLMMASKMSHRQGWVDASIPSRVETLLKAANLPLTLYNPSSVAELGENEFTRRSRELNSEKFLQLMSVDKKVSNGQLSLVLLKGDIGNCIITDKFDEKLLHTVVKEYCYV